MAEDSAGLLSGGAYASEFFKAAGMPEATASAAAAAMNAAAPRPVPSRSGMENTGEYAGTFKDVSGSLDSNHGKFLPEPRKVLNLSDPHHDKTAATLARPQSSSSPKKIVRRGPDKRSAVVSEFNATAPEFTPTSKGRAAPKGLNEHVELQMQVTPAVQLPDYSGGMGHRDPSPAYMGSYPSPFTLGWTNPYICNPNVPPLPFGFPPGNLMDPLMSMGKGGMPFMPQQAYPPMVMHAPPLNPGAAANQKKLGPSGITQWYARVLVPSLSAQSQKLK